MEREATFAFLPTRSANPVNLMGASKRLMEHVIFSGELASTSKLALTSARFANVAFSDGSLLQSFFKRLEKRQPLAAPRETQRFFISLREAGRICLLGAVCAPTHTPARPPPRSGRGPARNRDYCPQLPETPRLRAAEYARANQRPGMP